MYKKNTKRGSISNKKPNGNRDNDLSGSGAKREKIKEH